MGVANGTFVVLRSVGLGEGFDVSVPHHLRVMAEGSEISVYLDGGEQASINVSDSRYEYKWSGMRVSRAVGLFDNLEIAKIGLRYPPIW